MTTQNRFHAGFRGRRPAAAVALSMVLTLMVLPAFADHGLPHVNPLATGTFTDDVSAKFKVKGPGYGTTVLSHSDASNMWVIQILIEAGGVAPWHTHTGTGLLINLGPGTVTNLVGEDCVPRLYGPGEAFVDPGIGDFHGVLNETNDEVELLAVFFGVEGPPVIPTDGGPDECFPIP